MKNKFRYIFLLCIGFMFVFNSAYAAEYDFIIGNKKLNEENSIITDGDDGRAIWNSEEKTLYLENFDYEGLGTFVEMEVEEIPGIYTIFGSEDPGDVKIIVKGKNTFKYSDDAFNGKDEYILEMVGFFLGNVTFEGNGEIDFITSDSDNVLLLAGLMSFNDLNVIDTKIKITSFQALAETAGISASNKIDAKDASLIVNVNENNISYGITSHEINLDSTYVEINLDDGTVLKGIEDSETTITNSVVKINNGVSVDSGYGISSEDILTLNNSKLVINTDKRGIVTDVLVTDKTSMSISAEGGVIARGCEFDFSSYKANNYGILLNTSAVPNPVGFSAYEDQTDLSMYPFLSVSVPSSNGEVKYDLELTNIQVETDNVASFYEQTEVDKLKIGYDADILFSLNISDEYNLYDTDIVNDNLGEYTLGKIVDISLLKKIGSGRNIKIANLNDKIKISYKLDDELVANNREYAVLRVHNGKTEILDTEYDATTSRILFETEDFSTYAILYKTLEVNPPTGDNLISYIVIGIISLIGLGCGLYLNKRKKIS